MFLRWINNGWVIGIATSVISGLAVTWVLRIFLSKKEDREYQQKVSAANRDVIYAIRPGIPEGQIPTYDVIVALANATARKYGVSVKELYGPRELMEELMKEVMDSSFLSSAKKAEYCTQLVHIRDEPKIVSDAAMPVANSEVIANRRKVVGNIDRLAALGGIVVGSVGLLLSVVEIKDIPVTRILEIAEKMTIAAVLLLFAVTFGKNFGAFVMRNSVMRKSGKKPSKDEPL
jgi:hypothetical protein